MSTAGRVEDMEPRILLMGRLQSTVDVLVEELARAGRSVTGTTSVEAAQAALGAGEVDLVVIGPGLHDEARDLMVTALEATDVTVPVHSAPHSPAASPARSIQFTHDLAVEWKVRRAMGL